MQDELIDVACANMLLLKIKAGMVSFTNSTAIRILRAAKLRLVSSKSTCHCLGWLDCKSSEAGVLDQANLLPVVPHKAVAEVSKIGNV